MQAPESKNAPTLSVIVPAYNEEATLAHVVGQVLEAVPPSSEIIIVDDFSSDATKSIAQDLAIADPRVRLLCHAVNSGKTAALISGFAQSRGDIVIVQDADLEYNPADIPQVIAPILEGRADVVYGSRFLDRDSARMVYFYQHAANRFLTIASNLFSGLSVSDVETCYKAFRGPILRDIEIVSKGFGFEIEITAKIAARGCSLVEVPIRYTGRTYEEGKKIGVKDCLAALWYILYFNSLGSRRAFPRK
jgi:glycosyltransferase involved in cell wall biosynthesis